MNAALVLRDARCDARRPRTYALRVLYGLALAFVLDRAWSAVGPAHLLPTASDLAQAGRELHRGFFLTQFVVVSLLALVAGAESIGRELRSGTMRLLVLTPVPESGIVASKWGAVMLQSAVLSLCGVPFLAACAYLGALGPGDVAAGFVVTLSNAALAAACGLRAAATARSTGSAILRGATSYLGWASVPVVLALFTAGVSLLMGPFLHPLYAAYYLLDPNPMLGSVATATSAAVAAALAARLIGQSGATLARRLREMPDLLEPLPSEEPPRPWALTWWPLRWGRHAVWDDAPLLWKDLFTRPAARLSDGGILALGTVVFLVWYLAVVVDQGRSEASVAIPLAVFCALSVLAGAGLFTHEKESRRIEPLLCGPLPTARIAASRVLSILLTPEAALVGILTALTVAVNARAGLTHAMWLGAALLLIQGIVYLLASAASLRMTSLPSAAGLTAGVLAIAWLAVPAALPGAAPWVAPWPLLNAIRDVEEDVPALFGRYAAAQGAVAAALLAWIVARLRPTVLEARG